MIPNKKYENLTMEEKIQYNIDQVNKIKEHISNMPIMYCGGIDCYQCPCNISPMDTKTMTCIAHIHIVRPLTKELK